MTQTPVRRSDPSVGAASTQFHCAWRPSGSRAAWIHLGGELDAAAAPSFERALQEARADAVMVVVDLRDLQFIDCAALAVLVRVHADARRSRRSLVLLRGSGQVDRLLNLTGLLEGLEVVDLQTPTPLPLRPSSRRVPDESPIIPLAG